LFPNPTPARSRDISALQIYDSFSVHIPLALEGYGYCGIGESGAYVAEGRMALGGAGVPVNTNGGQLSESYMWGWLHLCEAVRQLRGECGPRQVAGARVAQHCSTKAFDRAATSVLSTW